MTLDIATQNQAALELTGKIAANPALAEPILKILKQLGGDVERLQSLDLSALISVQEALPKSQLSTEQTLRAENRIQDDAAILAKLGFKGELPSIPAELIEECARTGGTLVLKFKTTILDYQANLNAALGSDKAHLHLDVCDEAYSLAATNEEPSWINVPNTVIKETLAMSRVKALNHLPGSATCDAMDIVLMLGFNNLQAGEPLAGFIGRYTFTNQMDTTVGSSIEGISVFVHACHADDAFLNVGLAPRLAPEPKI